MVPDEYFDIAAPMYVAQRYVHPDCTKADERGALIITRVPEGWKWSCFRCGQWGLKKTSTLSPNAYVMWQKTKDVQQQAHTKTIHLPDDFTSSIPSKGLAWLYKYGVTDREIGQFNIGYSPSFQRVILPVYNREGTLVYWQGRTLGKIDKKKNPKYLNIWGTERNDAYFRHCFLETDKVVLVEDILSAICVGRNEDSIALLYSYVPDKLILELVQEYREIILWLDKDKWDRMLERVVRYRSFGYNVRMINSELDPKSYSDDQIYDFVNWEEYE